MITFHLASRSNIKVTGPSFSIPTDIIAPNSPVSTFKPLVRNLSTKLLYKSTANIGLAERSKEGRRPLVLSP